MQAAIQTAAGATTHCRLPSFKFTKFTPTPMKNLLKNLTVAITLIAASSYIFAQDVMAEGKKLFTQVAPACSVCHVMSHAGSVGEVGPSLDELKPDAARVEKALRNGIGQMPAFKSLTNEQVMLLSKYVAAATGAAK